MHAALSILQRAILIIAGALGVASAHAKDPIALLPTGAWEVHYADQKCTAARGFGSGKDAVTLLIDQFGPGDSFKLAFIGKRFARWAENTVRLRFGPNEEWQDAEFFLGNYGKGTDAIIFRSAHRIAAAPDSYIKSKARGEDVELPPVSAAQLAAVRWLALRRVNQETLLATGRLDKLFAELAKCNDKLVKSWGFDPVAMATLEREPKPLSPPSTWIQSNDYPLEAIIRGERGIVMVRLNVDERGAVTKCQVQQSKRGDEFPKIVCDALMKRAKFAPALTTEGKPIAAYWRNSVIFSIPK